MAREPQVRAMSLPPFPVHAELISVAADPLRLAILVPTVSSWPDGRASVGAISLAVEEANRRADLLGGRRLVYQWREVECDASNAPAAISLMLQKGPIDAVVGPDCSLSCESTAHLTAGLNIPQISYSCTSPGLSDKDVFPTFVRTTSSYGSWAPAIVSFAEWAGWQRMAALSSTENLYLLAAQALNRYTSNRSMSFELVIEFTPIKVGMDTEAWRRSRSAELERLVESSVRVAIVMAYGADVLSIALLATKRGLTTGWAWLGLDTVRGAEDFSEPRYAAEAVLALQGWVFFEPQTGLSVPTDFSSRVRVASLTAFPADFNGTQPDVTPFAANMYDAVMLYATVAWDYPAQVRNGTRIVSAMMSTSVDGISGRVQLDARGDMIESIQMVNYAEQNGTNLQRVGVYDGVQRHFSRLAVTLYWPGGVTQIPMDVVRSDEPSSFSTLWLIIAGGGAALVVVVLLLIVVRRKHQGLQHILVMFFTESLELVGSLFMEMVDLATDCMAANEVFHNHSLPREGYRVAYGVFTVLSSLGFLVSVAYRIYNGRQLRERISMLSNKQVVRGNSLRNSLRVHESLLGVGSATQKLLDVGSASQKLLARIGTLKKVSHPESASGGTDDRIMSSNSAHSSGRASPDRVQSLGCSGRTSPDHVPSQESSRTGSKESGRLRRMPSLRDCSNSSNVAIEGLKRQAEKYQWELDQSYRTLVVCSLIVMTVCIEDLPFIVINALMMFLDDVKSLPVILSTLMSMLLIGYKFNALKEIVVTIQRRQELRDFLDLWHHHLDEEAVKQWWRDVLDDKMERDAWIAQLESEEGEYTPEQTRALDECAALFASMEGRAGTGRPMPPKATITRAETIYDEERGELFGMAEATMYGATPQQVIAYAMNFAGKHVKSKWNPKTDVEAELLELGHHHAIIYNEFKLPPPIRNRTFLNMIVCKKLSDSPLAFWLVVFPLASHAKVSQAAEKGKVRGEVNRCFKLTLLEHGNTRMEYVCYLDVKGRVPTNIAKRIAVPKQMNVLYDIQAYFQMIRHADDCSEEDVQTLAHLLMDRVERPTESGKRARLSEVVKFVNCTELLRAAKFAHLDIMLNAMIVASPYAFVFDPADISTKDIDLVTEDEAAAMGRNFVSILLRVGLVPIVRLGSGSYSPVPRRRSPRGRMWPKFGSEPQQRSLTTSPPRGPAQLRARQSRIVSTGFEAAEAVSTAVGEFLSQYTALRRLSEQHEWFPLFITVVAARVVGTTSTIGFRARRLSLVTQQKLLGSVTPTRSSRTPTPTQLETPPSSGRRSSKVAPLPPTAPDPPVRIAAAPDFQKRRASRSASLSPVHEPHQSAVQPTTDSGGEPKTSADGLSAVSSSSCTPLRESVSSGGLTAASALPDRILMAASSQIQSRNPRGALFNDSIASNLSPRDVQVNEDDFRSIAPAPAFAANPPNG